MNAHAKHAIVDSEDSKTMREVVYGMREVVYGSDLISSCESRKSKYRHPNQIT